MLVQAQYWFIDLIPKMCCLVTDCYERLYHFCRGNVWKPSWDTNRYGLRLNDFWPLHFWHGHLEHATQFKFLCIFNITVQSFICEPFMHNCAVHCWLHEHNICIACFGVKQQPASRAYKAPVKTAVCLVHTCVHVLQNLIRSTWDMATQELIHCW